MIHDVAIIGAGPAGLCLARALSGQGLSIVLLERQAETALADPAFDGREIALTHASQAQLEQLGLWSASRLAAAPVPSSAPASVARRGARLAQTSAIAPRRRLAVASARQAAR